ncbi:MAG TPA: cation:proton antiporter [Sedimenticola sp.]|nr:cation:proton antiporter [Sedimenticola sp.]
MTLTLPVILEWTALFLIATGILLATIRLFLGPTTPDRVVAADTLGVITTAGLALLASVFKNPIYLDVALVYGTLAFVGTVAIARTIEGNRK